LIATEQKFVNSAAHSILTTGAQSAEAFNIVNPDFQGQKGQSTTISGGQAYLKIIASTIAGTGYRATGSGANPLQELLGAYTKGQWGQVTDSGSVSDDGRPAIRHGNVTYIPDPEAPGLGSRAVALDSELSEEEKAFYIERGTLLYQTLNKQNCLKMGFDIDFPDTWDNFKLWSTHTYFPNIKQDPRYLDNAIITAPVQKAYISAALMELLILLTDKIGFSGGFGIDRAIVKDTAENKAGINGSDAQASSSKGTVISDHVFGRGFDIMQIGRTRESILAFQPENVNDYENKLEFLLEALSTVPMPLLPDLIMIHPEVAARLGVSDGLEGPATAIKSKYPNLKYVNFGTDINHKDHIHISFSSERGGKYIGSEGLITSTNTGTPPVVTDETQAAITTGRQKARISFMDNFDQLSELELFSILTERFFEPEPAAIFCAIAAREGNRRPGSFNGKCKVNSNGSWGGDYSIGFLQYNLIARMKKSSDYADEVPIYFDGTKDLSTPAMVKVSHLAYKKGADANLSNNAIGAKMVELQNKGKPETDPRIWYPINQVGFTAFSAFNYSGTPISRGGAGFGPWGDYSDRSVCGFIFNIEYQDVVSVYLTTGKDIAILEEWIKKNITATSNKKAASYLSRWMMGSVFDSKGVLKSTKAINYVAASGSGGTGSPAVLKKIDNKLAIIGNGTLQQCSTLVNDKMPTTPWNNYKVDGDLGRRTSLANTPPVKSVLDAIIDLKTTQNYKPEAYIIVAGSADITFISAQATMKASIIKVMKQIGKVKTYWFNTYGKTTDDDTLSRSILWNQALAEVRAMAEFKDWLLSSTTLEWDKTVQGTPGYLSENGITLSDLGKEAFSLAVQQAANNLAAIVVPGSYSVDAGGDAVPIFTKAQISEAAQWLKANRLDLWQTTYNKTIGCEGFANRLSAGLGLYPISNGNQVVASAPVSAVFNAEWPESIPTNLTAHLTAQDHYIAVKNRTSFYKPSTPNGTSPPAGYVVYWTGGTGELALKGHVGISIGGGKFIDESDQGEVLLTSDIWPGKNYTYVGASATW
jgi:hypothetical protein